MKRLIVSAFFAAILCAPAFAGGDCCAKKDGAGATAAQPAAAACAKESTHAQNATGKHAKGAAEANAGGQKADCCADKQAKTVSKACPTCASHNWMMAKPNPNCPDCQTASL